MLAMPSGDVGLIPACAGKTAVLHGPRELLAAHPRVCGENLVPRGRPVPWGGSSPRVRGKL